MEHISGVQHIGLPVRSMEETLAFYHKLGFETAYHTVNDGQPVAFLRGYGLTIEAYQTPEATGKPGAIDHIAFDVDDVDAVWQEAAQLGLQPIDPAVRFLPFWEKGVRFFTVTGPNAEKLEFSQMLK
ncbi:MAG: VOC family protein [Eubacteriales bacterium]|nr:VOC family protein [Eubacteriales bacterium]